MYRTVIFSIPDTNMWQNIQAGKSGLLCIQCKFELWQPFVKSGESTVELNFSSPFYENKTTTASDYMGLYTS